MKSPCHGKDSDSLPVTLPRAVPGDIWRININRYERPTREKENLSGWAPLFRQGYHAPERFGYVRFMDKY